VKIGASLRVILRLCLRNLRGCNVGITDGGFLKYAILIGSGAMEPVSIFIKFGSRFEKLFGRGGIHIQTSRQTAHLLFIFSK
jgi:hypothetical protein